VRHDEASDILPLKVVETRILVNAKADGQSPVLRDYDLVVILHNRPEASNLASIHNQLLKRIVRTHPAPLHLRWQRLITSQSIHSYLSSASPVKAIVDDLSGNVEGPVVADCCPTRSAGRCWWSAASRLLRMAEIACSTSTSSGWF